MATNRTADAVSAELHCFREKFRCIPHSFKVRDREEAMKRPFSYAALIFATLFMLPGIVAAQTQSSFPGSMCQPSSPSDQITRNDALGRMFNIDPEGTVEQIWICPILGPIISDEVAPTEIIVIDQGAPGNDITCSLCTANKDAPANALSDSLGCDTQTTRIDGSPRKISASPAAISMTFILNQRFLSSSGQDNGYYYFYCTIPSLSAGNPSAVSSYRWFRPAEK
jgi:hypothetical protein